MKTMKNLFAVMCFAIAALSSTAAITHNETVYGYDLENLTSDVGSFTSYYWEAFVFVQDDADGAIIITWYAYDGHHYAIYLVDANATNWTFYGGESVVGSVAESFVISYLNP